MYLPLLLSLSTLLFSPAGENSTTTLLDDILNKHADAMGGRERWANLKTLYIRLDTGDGGVMEAYTKKPDKFRLVLRFAGHEWIKSWDGTTGRSRYNGEEKILNAGEAREMAEEPYFFDELLLARELGYDVRLLTKEKLDNKTVYKIEVAKADDDVVTYFLNADTHLIERIGETSHDPKFRGAYFTTIFEDYRNWDGLRIPRRWGITGAGNPTRWMEVVDVIVDEPMEDSLFN